MRWVHEGRLIHPRSLGSLGCAMGLVGFIRGGWVHSGVPWGSLGSFFSFGSLGSALGALGSCWSLGSSEVVGFTCVRYVGRCVHPGSFG